jgi:hypothetical protein
MSTERGYPDSAYVYWTRLSGSGLFLLNGDVRIRIMPTERGSPDMDYGYWTGQTQMGARTFVFVYGVHNPNRNLLTISRQSTVFLFIIKQEIFYTENH